MRQLTFKLIFVALLLPLSTDAQKTPEIYWGKQAGSTDITVDENENIYAIGNFNSTTSVDNKVFNTKGDWDFHVSKLDNTGDIKWVKQFGSINAESATTIHADNQGNVYISGYFDQDLVLGNDTLKGNGFSNNIYLLKLDANGNVLWANEITGVGRNHILNNIATDNAGYIYMCTSISQTVGMNIVLGSYSFPGRGDYDEDIFIIKYNTNGDIVWATRAGGNNIDRPYGIAVDDAGYIYNTGHFTDTATFSSTQLVANSANTPQLYLSKYDSAGILQFVTTPKLGGSGTWLDVQVAYDGYLYLGGEVSDTTTFGNDTIKANSTNNGVLAKYDTTGKTIWVRQVAPGVHTNVSKVAVDQNNDVYANVVYNTPSVLKYRSSGNLIWNIENAQPGKMDVKGLATGGSAGVYVTGICNGATSFGNDALPGNSVFVAKVSAYPLDITYHSTTKNIKLYPNPNTGTFTLSGSDLKEYTSYDLINIVGQTVSKATLDNTNKVMVNIESLDSGIYVLRLYGNEAI